MDEEGKGDSRVTHDSFRKQREAWITGPPSVGAEFAELEPRNLAQMERRDGGSLRKSGSSLSFKIGRSPAPPCPTCNPGRRGRENLKGG